MDPSGRYEKLEPATAEKNGRDAVPDHAPPTVLSPPSRNTSNFQETASPSTAIDQVGRSTTESWGVAVVDSSVSSSHPAPQQEQQAVPVPADHWRYLWDVRRFQHYREDNVPPPTIVDDGTHTLPEGLSVREPSSQRSVDDELQKMLAEHYVEDDEGLFRFAYSSDFLQWALFGPTSDPDRLHIRIVEDDSERLVAFFSATPMAVQVADGDRQRRQHAAALVDFVCVAREHRGKGICPWMYREAQRRCAEQGLDVLLCTSGDELPTPVASPRYHHLTLDAPFLLACGFLNPPPPGRPLTRCYPLLHPSPPSVPLRELSLEDVPSARKLLNAHMDEQAFDISAVFDSDEHFAHTFLPKEGVVMALVRVSEYAENEVIEFISFYFIDSLVIGECPHKGQIFRGAYLFYNAPSAEETRRDLILEAAHFLKERAGAHVINALPVMGLSAQTLRRMAFGKGTGLLHHYLCNFPGPTTVEPEKLAVFPGL